MVLVTTIAALALAMCMAPFVYKAIGNKIGWLLSSLFAGLFIYLLAASNKAQGQNKPIESSYTWIKYLNLNFDLKLDGLGLLFALVVLGIGSLVMAYSAKYLPKTGNASFYLLMTAFASAMFGMVVSNNIILLFIFWEMTTLCSFFLISRSGFNGYQPSIRTFILTGTGGISLLTAVSIMSVRTGTTKISEILTSPVWSENKTLTAVVAVLVIIAAFTKSAQFPFHIWLPDAMVAAMPISAYLHAAAMVKAGIFLLMRFTPIFSDTPTWNILLISIGITTGAIGAVLAIGRDDLKEMLAYSTVSQLGLIVATIGLGTKYALIAASTHVLAHALFKSSLFMITGVIEKQSGTRKLSELKGFSSTSPLTSLSLLLASLSMAGLVPLLGFVSKESILKAFTSSELSDVALGICVASIVTISVLTFTYSLKMILGIYTKGNEITVKPAGLLLSAPLIASTIGLILGIYPQALNSLVKNATEASILLDTTLKLTLWHGVTTELYLTISIYVLGITLVLNLARVTSLVSKTKSPINGIILFDQIRSGLHYLGKRTTYLTKTDKPSRHLVVPMFVLICFGAFVFFNVEPLGPVINNADSASDFFLLTLMVLPVLGLMIVKSRIAGVVLLGSVGLILVIYFFNLGAPDVGMTQLLVELLIVVFMMFSLRRLPKNFHHTSARRKVWSAAVAILSGTTVGFAVYFFVGRRELSAASQYYIANAKEETGGTNIVNTILVDFRALDTLGEMTVLATAGLAIMALLISVRVLQPRRRSHHHHSPTAADSFLDNLLPIRFVSRLLIGIIIIISVYLMLRGHYEPGGGFIAALTTSIGIAMLYLGTTHRDFIHSKGLPYVFLSSGVLIALATASIGYMEGNFLNPIHIDFSILSVHLHLSSSMLFDTGVYLAVIGVVLAAINRLSLDDPALLRNPMKPKLVTAVEEEDEE